ncbi:MAG: hypothetical protein E7449_01020 [Ruminococcaceae bacterium]|nr:hypothetical protein [Oscillospiraceae bacterium]
MKNQKNIEYKWPDLGKLSVQIHGTHAASLRFVPSEKLVMEHLAKDVQATSQPINGEQPSNTHEE